MVKKTIVVKEDTTLTIRTQDGKTLIMTILVNGNLLMHTHTSDIRRIVIGYGDNDFKVAELNDDGSIYAIEKFLSD